MNEPFKYQYKSQNLARLQEIFVNDTHSNFKTNYTITNKSVKSPIKFSNFNKDYDYELVSNKTSSIKDEYIPKASFVKKYNKVLNEFCVPSGKKYITVDLDDKLKLNYLKFQIEESRTKANKSNLNTRDKLDDIKNNFILGSPYHSSKSDYNLNINLSPRSLENTLPKSPSSRTNFIKDKNFINKKENNLKIYTLSKNTTNSSRVSDYEQLNSKTKYEFLDKLGNQEKNYNAFNKFKNRATSPVSKANYSKKEIINSLFDEPNKPLSTFEKIQRLRGSSSFEKDLRKRVILSGKIYK